MEAVDEIEMKATIATIVCLFFTFYFFNYYYFTRGTLEVGSSID